VRVKKMNRELKNTVNSLLSKNSRLDGRKSDEYRAITIETGVTRNAEGSARVKIGDTEVMAGVKMEVGKPYPDTQDRGGMMFNVELTPMSSPDFETGPPGNYAIELARVTDRAIRESKCIDVRDLCIEVGEKVWTMIVDIVPINEAGNMFDAASLAAAAAIKDAKLPELKDGMINYKVRTDSPLPLTKELPLSVTVLKCGNSFLVDPTEEEEKVFDARLTVGVQADGNLCSMQKGGNDALSAEDISKMLDLAIKKTAELRKHLK
jgi:exosome complex component RRP42